jgi:hypothetical protein
MPDEFKIATVIVEEGTAYAERHPGSAISKMAEFVADNYGKIGAVGVAALALAGCAKKKDHAHPLADKVAAAQSANQVVGSGDDLVSGAKPTPVPTLVEGANGKSPISVLANLSENELPKSLPMQDLPAQTEANRQFVWANVDHIILENEAGLTQKQNYGWFGNRDLRPVSDVAPDSGSAPGTDYAVALDKANRPVDVLTYYNPGTGNKYLEQYQFKYGQLADGTNRSMVTVMDWKDSTQTSDAGPRQIIGNKLNTLEGVSQYYYDSTGKCVEALYYQGWAMNGPKANWTPALDMKFGAGQVSISEQNPRSGQMSDFYTPSSPAETALTVRSKAATLKFFDLLGPSQ